ncbi:Rv2253/PknI dimerization domain-containing protein [Mycolicibacterium celeriflavum]|uniref:Uncharacterized protein n=1 Tax=Mycolicibacterium celeriflavum TaxID=1249101 RepID=A0A1X0BK75_MYCCF|nr:hypothetical protein [Mycolicibacterium celeriflavum]ORA42910.1 hypothetical protein BST21_22665 [Mycolicibacterium celeriflavum]BBY42332.1 hypothetical protein MCEL_06270 [Mycolicibacterium celeriflavum]
MRFFRAAGLATALVTGAISVVATPGAHASDDEWGLNGTYIATSNGEWSKTNEVFRDQASLRSTWTISTECSYPTECTGTVASDFGWTAPIYKTGGVWYVKHTVENWVPCPDGTAAPGLQVFRFVPVVEDGSMTDPASTTLAGEDQTTGLSGACGVSKAVFINMPFKLVKAGT